MKKLPLLVFIISVLPGCAMHRNIRSMKSLIGKEESEMVHQWGVPDSSMKLSQGETAYQYNLCWNTGSNTTYVPIGSWVTSNTSGSGKICAHYTFFVSSHVIVDAKRIAH